MPVSLTKGANVNLSKEAPGLKSVRVGLGWDTRVTDGTEFDLDCSVFVLGENGRVRNDQVAALEARLNALRGAGAYFTIRDYRRSGSISATLATVQANGTVNISGGPANGTLRDGDYLAFGYANRIALHQIVVGGALNGTGARNGVEVVPPIRPGWAAGVAVTIGSPKCRAVMVPGSLRVGLAADRVTEGISFDWTQTLRENP